MRKGMWSLMLAASVNACATSGNVGPEPCAVSQVRVERGNRRHEIVVQYNHVIRNAAVTPHGNVQHWVSARSETLEKFDSLTAQMVAGARVADSVTNCQTTIK